MKLYFEATQILETVLGKKGRVKSLVYSSNYSNKKQLLALTSQTLKYLPVLKEVISAANLQKTTKLLKAPLVFVLVYELLFGAGLTPQIKGKFEAELKRHRPVLSAELARLKVKRGVQRNEDLLPKCSRPDSIPRYVRINKIKISVEEAVERFQKSGFIFKQPLPSDDASTWSVFVEVIATLKKKEFVKDFHFQDLLVFSPNADLHKHPLYTSGSVVLQEKASTVPARCLNPPEGAVVLDCCAAPGNKTSQLAAMVGPTGKVYAVDVDRKRLATLARMMEQQGITWVQTIHADVTRLSPDDARLCGVTHVLVDPSCSGSGIVGWEDYGNTQCSETEQPTRFGSKRKSRKYANERGRNLNKSAKHSNEEAVNDKRSRLEALATFQHRVVTHAMLWPNVSRLVYSTCSVHVEENEHVIRRVLADTGSDYQLVNVLPEWPMRGIIPECSTCLRFSSEETRTQGFFIATFRKVSCGKDTFAKDVGTDKIIQGRKSNTSHRKKLKRPLAESPESNAAKITPNLCTDIINTKIHKSKKIRKRKRIKAQNL